MSIPARYLCFFMLAALAAGAGCDEEGGGSPDQGHGGADLGRVDSGPDLTVPDQKAAPDLTPDLGASMEAGSATARTVLYITGKKSNHLTAYTVKADGTGKKAVSQMPAAFLLNAPLSDHASPWEYGFVSRNRPVAMGHVDLPWRYIHLPNKLGQLYQFTGVAPYATAARGFFQVKPDGTIRVLDSIKGTSPATNTYHSKLGVKPDGSMFAAPYAHSSTTHAGLKLIRTDGKVFSGNGKGVCDITSTKPRVYKVQHLSYRFSSKHLYFVAQSTATAGQTHLLRAPLDCSAKAAEVTLPKVGGQLVKVVHDQVHMSEDGSRLMVLAGANNSKADVLVLNTATGAVVNVTDKPGSYQEPGYMVMFNDTGAHRGGLSSSGKYVAWTTLVAGGQELYVRPTDKSKPAVHLTSNANFSPAVDTVNGVEWLGDDDLFFWAGTHTKYQDGFHYRASIDMLNPLTNIGGSTKPFPGYSTMAKGLSRPRGGWWSPNGKHLFYLEERISAKGVSRTTIEIVTRATGYRSDHTPFVNVRNDGTNLEAAEGSPHVFFAARPAAVSGGDDLYYLNQNSGSKPVKLTHLGSTTPGLIIDAIFPAHGGKQVAFTAGTAAAQSLYVVSVSSNPVTTKVDGFSPGTGLYQWIADQKVFSSDGKALAYGLNANKSNDKYTLRWSPIPGGKEVVLDPTEGYTHVLAVY